MRTSSRVAAGLAAALAAPLLQATPSLADTGDPVPEPEKPGDQSNGPTAGTTGVGNVAHKGYSASAPENTMDSVRQAIAEQGDFHGIDIRRTADSRLVVVHDESLARTTNVENVFPNRSPWNVSDFTFDEIQRLDAGSWFRHSYAGEKIPSLEQMLSSLDTSPSGVFLEVKDPAKYPGIRDQVVQAVRNNTDWLDSGGTDHRLVIQSFDEGFLQGLHNEYPGIPVGALGEYDPSDLDWLDQINVQYSALGQDEVDRAKNAGVQVSTFTVDDRDTMETKLDQGVDAICTNRPRLLHEVLAERRLDQQHPEFDAERQSQVGSDWQVAAPGSAQFATRVPVSASFTDSSGQPVRWSWATLQTYYSGKWHDIQRRATDSNGHVSTTMYLRRDIKARWAPWREQPSGATESPASRIDGRRAPTTVRLAGWERVHRGNDAKLTVRWRSQDGRRISGPVHLWSRPRGADHWTQIASRDVTRGYQTFTVSPRRTTEYQVRAESGWWWRGDRDTHRVAVVR